MADLPASGTLVVVTHDAHVSFAPKGDKVVRLQRHEDGQWVTTSNGQGLVCTVQGTKGTPSVAGLTIQIVRPFSRHNGVYAEVSK